MASSVHKWLVSEYKWNHHDEFELRKGLLNNLTIRL